MNVIQSNFIKSDEKSQLILAGTANLLITTDGGGNGVDDSVQQVGYFDPVTESSTNPSIASLIYGAKWGGEVFGVGLNLTYSFASDSSVYGLQNEFVLGKTAFLSAQKTAAQAAQAALSAVSGLTFSAVVDGPGQAGDIRWGNTNASELASGFAYFPNGVGQGGDIWFSNARTELANPVLGSYAFQTFLHELGHAVGLNHPHESAVVPVAGEDQLKYSLMSYKSFNGDTGTSYSNSFFPTTFMLNDILALQFLYGANTSYRTGNDSYSWAAESRIFETIWDAGGVDTLSAVGQTQGTVLYLTPGKWSQIGASFWNGQANVRDALTIAYGAVIENAVGSNFNDVLEGNQVANYLDGSGANDMLSGAGGNDTLDGGSGNDTADYSTVGAAVTAELWRGTASNDGQGSNDVLIGIENLNGGNFNDTLAGDEGVNNLNGAGGDDSIFAGGGSDSLIGGAGNDWLVGGGGIDTLNGGTGLDTADYASVTAAVTAELWRGTASNDGQGGNDVLVGIEHLNGGNFNDLLGGDEGANSLNGAGGNDSIFGGGGSDSLIGGAGNDWLVGSGGIDNLNGGTGVDTADYTSATAAVTAELWRGTASNDGHGGNDVLVAIENLNGGSFNDLLVGDEAANSINGLGGNDNIFAGGGNDSLIGGVGNDWLAGGAGNDSLTGEAGSDTADYASATSAVTAELWRGTAANDGQGGNDILVGIENLNGGGFNDLLVGDEAANNINGAAGNDVLYGGGGVDTLFGGNGNDFAAAGAGNDSLDGGSGIDTVDYASATSGVVVELWKNSASNDGQGGSDVVLNFENLNGGNFNDFLVGNEGANVILAGNGIDTVYGGGGDDFINGGNGNDLLAGGAGRDIYRFDTALNTASNLDTASDFVVADDTISLARPIFGSLAAGTLGAGNLRAGVGVTSAVDADDFILYNSSTGALYYDADGSGAALAVQFAILPVGLALNNGNFTIG